MKSNERSILKLLDNFKAGKILVRSSEIFNLANEVAKQINMRDSENIDGWAAELAGDVSKLND